MSNKKESFFWTSYSDLMTSLFFIMLVLFILVIVLLHKRMEVTEQTLDKVRQAVSSVKDLDKDKDYFEYNEVYEKYVLKVDVFFPMRVYDIDALSPECQDSLETAGRKIVDFLDRHRETKYLLIVEGQASMNSEAWSEFNYNLSFQRAESLMRFWLETKHLNFGDNCEVQIAGSGDGRLNIKSMRHPIEEKNQRFLIHILPKNIFKDDKE